MRKIGTIVHVAVDSAYMGYIVVSDSLKPQSAETIARLKDSGVGKTIMLRATAVMWLKILPEK